LFIEAKHEILCHRRLNSSYGRFQTDGNIVDDLNS